MKSLLLTVFLLCGTALYAEAPPGHNVHTVTKTDAGTMFWRGGGVRKDTLQALQARAKETGRPVTLIDLRHPPFDDDLKGGGGRLAPAAEEKTARELGLRYRSISALDKGLVPVIDEALKKGDVYIHCMYGVNRTGFAVGRYATARNLKVERTKLGERDWKQGVDFQRNMMR